MHNPAPALPSNPVLQKPSPDTAPSPHKHNNRKGVVLILLVLLICASFGGVTWYTHRHPKLEGVDYTGWSDQDIQDDLNNRAAANMMAVSVATVVSRNGDQARVNVINTNDAMNQSFAVSQNGKVLYTSGILLPGKAVEWANIPGLKSGDAKIQVTHVDGNGEQAGSSTTVNVKVS